jgi:hypothetical protein
MLMAVTSQVSKDRTQFMAIKKSDLYSSLWASCDELRGGMDASQYKDYVLFMLFIKYVSDKYGDSDDFAPPVTIPKGSSFKDMIALKGKSDIGDKINTQIIQPLIDANSRLARTDFPDFNDPNKLGEAPRTRASGRRRGEGYKRRPQRRGAEHWPRVRQTAGLGTAKNCSGPCPDSAKNVSGCLRPRGQRTIRPFHGVGLERINLFAL